MLPYVISIRIYLSPCHRSYVSLSLSLSVLQSFTSHPLLPPPPASGAGSGPETSILKIMLKKKQHEELEAAVDQAAARKRRRRDALAHATASLSIDVILVR